MSFLSSLLTIYCHIAFWLEQNPYFLSIVRWINCLITREPYNWSICYVYRDNGKLIQQFDKKVNATEYVVFSKTGKGTKILVNKEPSSFIPMEKVRHQFLSIQYRTNEKIADIELPNEYYIEGNEILSSLFVERCCKQYHPLLEFNHNYALILFDSSMKETILTGNQYILLTKDGFQTMTTT